MAAAIDGSIAAPAELEGLFLAHHARALKAAYRVTGSMSDAEDVAQALFLRILQQGACRQAIDNPESYIYRAAINAALDLLRKRRREAEVPVEEDEERGVPELGPEPALVEGREGDEEVGEGAVLAPEEILETESEVSCSFHGRSIARVSGGLLDARIRVLER